MSTGQPQKEGEQQPVFEHKMSSSVALTLYGEKGRSEELALEAEQPDIYTPGMTGAFTVST